MAKSKRKRRPRAAAPTRPIVAESPLARLKRMGSLNVFELTAADEIMAAYAMSTGSPVTRDPDLGLPPSAPRPDAADDQAARRSDLIRVFEQWSRDLIANVARAVTIGLVVREGPLSSFDQRYGWRNGTAKRHLLTGLRHYAALRGNTPRGARGWKVV